MSLAVQSSKVLSIFTLAMLLFGCEEEAKKEAPPPKPSASVAEVAPPPAPTPSVQPPKLRDDCPEGSSGVGTQAEPCLGKGDSRMMEVTYTGKTTDEGPKFSIVNKSKNPILFGSLVAYFYDKSGKQLEVTSDGKPRPMQVCSGRIFAGAVKPGEKIFMFFSCVKKAHVPEGTATIQAEVKTVGFTDEAGRESIFYWSNPDLAPEKRPKSDLKSKPKK
ncbi:MAG TPA: hypothetical protein VFK05_12075 [Polyangiaceae bacterium]|nr:hypothetical protein [Polyangiaceae bacterium]